MGCAISFIDRDTDKHTGFICGEGIESCAICGRLALHLCDYPMGKGKMCDAPLCCNHAIRMRAMPQNKVRVAVDDEIPDDEIEWVEFCPQHSIIEGKKCDSQSSVS